MASQYRVPLRGNRDADGRPDRPRPWRASVHRHRLYPLDSIKGLAVIGREQDILPIRRPPGHTGADAQIGESPNGTALRWHRIYFRMPLLTAGEGQRRSVRGETGQAKNSEIGGKAAGDPARNGDAPEIIFRYKNDGVPINGGETVVSRRRHDSSHGGPS